MDNEIIFKRRSIRKFKDIEITDEQINEILRCGMAAPSAINRKPWKFYVIRNKDIYNQICALSPNLDKKSPVQIVVCGDISYCKDGDLMDWWIEDCSAATQNILLGATSLGLGSLWCGLFPRKDRYTAVSKILNLPDNLIPFSFIHIGYSDELKAENGEFDLTKVEVIR